MPKPVKKTQKRLPVPPKPRRPSDPNRAAHALITEHMARLGQVPTPDAPPTMAPDFDAQFRAKMAELGKKGGTISGAKRMENLSDRKRKEIARKAAAARWKRG